MGEPAGISLGGEGGGVSIGGEAGCGSWPGMITGSSGRSGRACVILIPRALASQRSLLIGGIGLSFILAV
jgi:hypothetical protein